MEKQDNQKERPTRDAIMGDGLWNCGLICAFEFVRDHKKTVGAKSVQEVSSEVEIDMADSSPSEAFGVGDYISKQPRVRGKPPRSYWRPIGWSRISELVRTVQVVADCGPLSGELTDDEDGVTVADLAAPYWERPVGPIWWCHVLAGHPFVDAWLSNAQWMHHAIRTALRDESKLISDRMKHLLYEVPVRVSGGLLFELLGQSVGDPYVDEDDIPIVVRSWHAQNFLVTSLHVKGSAAKINVLGIAEVQELLIAGGCNVPRTIHEVVSHLACRLARWDDRLFRKSIFGAADEVELMFMDRRNHEDLHLFCTILNQSIRKLSTQVDGGGRERGSRKRIWVETIRHYLVNLNLRGEMSSDRCNWRRLIQVIRVKWSLHAREEIIFELLQHLKGNTAKNLLEGIRKSTRDMIEEQEAVRGRLFTIQDVMQSTVRAWLQDRSLRVNHNLGVFGGCGLVLSIITGLFGINLDGIPGAEDSPYAFALFSALLVVLGVVLIGIGLIYLGMKRPVMEEHVKMRKNELQELVRVFQQEAESHAVMRRDIQTKMSPTAAGLLPNGDGYILIG